MPYSLSEVVALRNERIDEAVTRTSPGVYALDKTTTGPFQVNYVGRADEDLKKRLKDWVGSKYKVFQV